MEKIILSKGYEFDLVAGGISEYDNKLEISFIPGEYTVEQLLEMFEGNNTFTVKNSNVSVQVFKNYINCKSINLELDCFIDSTTVCPECHAPVKSNATDCASCNATFESPEIQEVHAPVAKIVCVIPDINDRMNDAEESIEDLINTILG